MSLSAIARRVPGATRLFVGLHGWGANAADLAALADYLVLEDYHLVFPDAPFPHPYSPEGRMWYDLPAGYGFQSPPAEMQLTHLPESRNLLKTWLPQAAAEFDVPLEHTVLAGFSQGGAMALDVGLQLPLAAVLVLSGYLHGPIQPRHPASPVLMVHGRQDPVVPLAAARAARATLLAHQVPVTDYELDMGHEIQPTVLSYITQFCQGLSEPGEAG